jgi:hypothetical protein
VKKNQFIQLWLPNLHNRTTAPECQPSLPSRSSSAQYGQRAEASSPFVSALCSSCHATDPHTAQTHWVLGPPMPLRGSRFGASCAIRVPPYIRVVIACASCSPCFQFCSLIFSASRRCLACQTDLALDQPFLTPAGSSTTCRQIRMDLLIHRFAVLIRLPRSAPARPPAPVQ